MRRARDAVAVAGQQSQRYCIVKFFGRVVLYGQAHQGGAASQGHTGRRCPGQVAARVAHRHLHSQAALYHQRRPEQELRHDIVRLAHCIQHSLNGDFRQGVVVVHHGDGGGVGWRRSHGVAHPGRDGSHHQAIWLADVVVVNGCIQGDAACAEHHLSGCGRLRQVGALLGHSHLHSQVRRGAGCGRDNELSAYAAALGHPGKGRRYADLRTVIGQRAFGKGHSPAAFVIEVQVQGSAPFSLAVVYGRHRHGVVWDDYAAAARGHGRKLNDAAAVRRVYVVVRRCGGAVAPVGEQDSWVHRACGMVVMVVKQQVGDPSAAPLRGQGAAEVNLDHKLQRLAFRCVATGQAKHIPRSRDIGNIQEIPQVAAWRRRPGQLIAIAFPHSDSKTSDSGMYGGGVAHPAGLGRQH